jgi:hypothetical protein
MPPPTPPLVIYKREKARPDALASRLYSNSSKPSDSVWLLWVSHAQMHAADEFILVFSSAPRETKRSRHHADRSDIKEWRERERETERERERERFLRLGSSAVASNKGKWTGREEEKKKKETFLFQDLLQR